MYNLVTRVVQYFCFPDRPMKGGDILDFLKGENLRKGGSSRKGVGVWHPLQTIKLNSVNNKRPILEMFSISTLTSEKNKKNYITI